ncbi:unnamed protein product [Sphagnum troendelagicum]
MEEKDMDLMSRTAGFEFKGSSWKNGGAGDGFDFRLGFMANDTLRTSCKGVDSSRAFNANFHSPHQMVKLLLFTVGINSKLLPRTEASYLNLQ